MRLKLRGNPTPAESTIECYKRAANVACNSDEPEENAVGKMVLSVLANRVRGNNATDEVMECLAAFDAATRRIREEMRGIHS